MLVYRITHRNFSKLLPTRKIDGVEILDTTGQFVVYHELPNREHLCHPVVDYLREFNIDIGFDL
jgi:hypothetical protein